MAEDGEFDLNDYKRRMQGAVSVLKDEFNGLRTGRAHPSLLEHISVEAYDSQMPLNQVANVSVPRTADAERAGVGQGCGAGRGACHSELYSWAQPDN